MEWLQSPLDSHYVVKYPSPSLVSVSVWCWPPHFKGSECHVEKWVLVFQVAASSWAIDSDESHLIHSGLRIFQGPGSVDWLLGSYAGLNQGWGKGAWSFLPKTQSLKVRWPPPPKDSEADGVNKGELVMDKVKRADAVYISDNDQKNWSPNCLWGFCCCCWFWFGFFVLFDMRVMWKFSAALLKVPG